MICNFCSKEFNVKFNDPQYILTSIVPRIEFRNTLEAGKDDYPDYIVTETKRKDYYCSPVCIVSNFVVNKNGN